MKYPQFIKNGTTVAVAAPSFGIAPDDTDNYNRAKLFFENKGYKVTEAPSLFKEDLCASAPASVRAEEFTQLYEKENNGLIIAATGGETELLILSHLDTQRLKRVSPKWFLGYSDNTVIGYRLLTECDTASIYGYCVGRFGDIPLHETAISTIEVVEGKRNTVKSCDFYRMNRPEEIPGVPRFLECDTPSVWKTLSGKAETIKGRAIGGCLDLFPSIAGTPYDKTADFVNKYKDDGIFWFLEACDLNPAGVARSLWQMKECGWFENAKGFMFGRPLLDIEYCGYNFMSAVKHILGDSLPVIFDADFGHKPPILPIVNGSIMTATASDGRGELTFEFR